MAGRMSDDEIAAANDLLANAPPDEILRWAVRRFAPKLLMATAFGAEGCCILHWLGEIDPKTTVINLDTGYQFKETLELRDRIAERYGIAVEMKQAELTVPQYEAKHNGPLYAINPDQCCKDRKVDVLKKAAQGWHAWMTAIR